MSLLLLLRSATGGPIPFTLSSSVAVSTLDSEQVGKNAAPTVATAVTDSQQVGKAFAQLVGTACTDLEQAGKRLASSVGTAITKSAQAGKVLAPVVVALATRTVVAAKRISSSVTAIVTLTAFSTIQFFATLSASVGTLATLLKQVGKILTPGSGGGYGEGGYGDDPYGEGAGAGVTVLASLTSQVVSGFAATLNASVGTVAALTKQAGKLRSAAAGTAIVAIRSAGKLLGSSAAATALDQETVEANRNPSVLLVPTLAKSIAKTFSAAVTALVTLVEGAMRPLSFSISVGTAVTRRLSAGLPRALTVLTDTTYLRGVGHACASTATAGIGVVKDVAKTISTSVTGLVTLDPHFIVHNFLTLTTHVTVVASWFRKAVLTPVICSALTATAKVCDTLGLSAASDVLMAAVGQLDTTVTATPHADDSVTATPADDN